MPPAHLFTPFRVGRLDLANRIVIAPMCQYSAEDGMAGDYHLVHYGRFALGGAGLVILEATAVVPDPSFMPFTLVASAGAAGVTAAAIRCA